MSNNSKSGRIKFFNSEKGFGFITMDKTNKDVFMHISNWKGEEEPVEKQSVTFEVVEGKKGLAAENVKPV